MPFCWMHRIIPRVGLIPSLAARNVAVAMIPRLGNYPDPEQTLRSGGVLIERGEKR